MRFLIVGPGAMGLLFAARLKKFAEQEVILLDYKKDRAVSLNGKGIKVEGIRGKFHVHVPVFLKEDIQFVPDVVMIFVKAYSTKDAAYEIKDIISNETIIITLQNGLGNIHILESILKTKIYGGITAEGATLLEQGYVKHAGYGDTLIGPLDKRLLNVKDILNMAGFKTEIVDDIEAIIWGKLLINIAINPLTAIMGVKNGILLKSKSAIKIMEQCLKEAMEIVRNKGIMIPYKDPLKKVQEVCLKTSGNISSMLQDVLSHRATEIDFLNGAIVKEGETLGIKTPVNYTLVQLIHAIQETHMERIDQI